MLSADEDDFEMPTRTPKRRKSSGSRREVPFEDAPAGGETSGIIKRGQ